MAGTALMADDENVDRDAGLNSDVPDEDADDLDEIEGEGDEDDGDDIDEDEDEDDGTDYD